MDYEKKYKALVGKIEKAYLNAQTDSTKAVLEEIRPELKESEDEKIRRNIIAALKGEGYYDCDLTNECIAWLEKQGNEPNWCHHKVDLSGCSEEYRKAYYDGWNNCNMQHSQCASEKNDVIKCIINGMKWFYEDNKNATWGTDKWSMPVKHIIDVLEKQSEPKPTDKIELKKINSPVLSSSSNIGTNVPTEWSGQDESRLTHILHLLYIKDDKKYLLMFGLNSLQELEKDIAWLKSLKDRVQPKQEWIEEDERERKRVVGILEGWLSTFKETCYAEDCKCGIDWLKSLKDRVQPQPQKQWSEEDERRINHIIAFMSDKERIKDTETMFPIEEDIRWLNSIRPHNTWKPSEEQMEALDYYANSLCTYCDRQDDIRSLYNDLKKLIE